MIYRVIAKDTILFMKVSLTVEASSLKEAESAIARDFPNLAVLSIEEHVNAKATN
jgi:hypothetical protein